jgi:hypothetical protein
MNDLPLCYRCKKPHETGWKTTEGPLRSWCHTCHGLMRWDHEYPPDTSYSLRLWVGIEGFKEPTPESPPRPSCEELVKEMYGKI